MSAFRTTVLEPFLDWLWPLRVAVPQQSGLIGAMRRQWELADNRQTYRFNYSHISPLAIADLVPIRDEISLSWYLAVMEKVLVALENRAELDIGSAAAQVHRDKLARFRSLTNRGVDAVPELRDAVYDALKFDSRIGASSNHARTLQEYTDLFRAIGLPPVAADFQQDATFARMRVAGPNPVMLRRLQSLDIRMPVTNELFQVAAPEDSLDEALATGRLFLADYAILDGAETGSFPHGQKYLAAPIALFVVDRKTRALKPVAIQCQQVPGPQNPIVTPRDGWNWLIAKTFVEIADGNVHEAVTHLGRTHLSMEPFAVCAMRQLSAFHPLSHLLRPHFEGTLRINRAAWQYLIADRGAVEKLCSGSIQSARGLAVKAVQTIDVMNSLLPNTFVDRGVDDPAVLPDYPYRDDSLLHWNAIHEWVHSYVTLYYLTDSAVAGDIELQAWAGELASGTGGKITGLPAKGALQTISELVDVLTFVIFTCSVQHAAVNFPQYDDMAYAPNMPLASYKPVLTSTTGATEADFVAMLPTLDMAELQMELGYLLGGVHFTQLGQYDKDQFQHDGRAISAQQKFQSDLVRIGSTIAERNQHRLRPYTPLLPSGIPQSINI